jgi:hypothetical protein
VEEADSSVTLLTDEENLALSRLGVGSPIS